MSSHRKEEPPEFIRKGFPRTWYYPKWKLMVWHPRGIFNEAFADQIIEFIEMEENVQDAPFDRYADLSGLTEMRIRFNHVLKTASRRRRVRQPVKSGIFADTPLSFSVAKTYEHLMEGGMIEVLAVPSRKAAAAFFDVPIKVLEPPG